MVEGAASRLVEKQPAQSERFGGEFELFESVTGVCAVIDIR